MLKMLFSLNILILVANLHGKINFDDQYFQEDFYRFVQECKNPESAECKKAEEDFNEFIKAYENHDGNYFKKIAQAALPEVPTRMLIKLFSLHVLNQLGANDEINKKCLIEGFLEPYLLAKQQDKKLTLKEFIAKRLKFEWDNSDTKRQSKRI